MAAMIEASSTTAIVETPVQAPDFEDPTSWGRAAFRAHAVLSQTMPDEEIDELTATAIPFHRGLSVFPRYFFG